MPSDKAETEIISQQLWEDLITTIQDLTSHRTNIFSSQTRYLKVSGVCSSFFHVSDLERILNDILGGKEVIASFSTRSDLHLLPMQPQQRNSVHLWLNNTRPASHMAGRGHLPSILRERCNFKGIMEVHDIVESPYAEWSLQVLAAAPAVFSTLSWNKKFLTPEQLVPSV